MTTGLEFVNKVRVYQCQRDNWFAALETYTHMQRTGASQQALAIQLSIVEEAHCKAQLLAFNIADCAVGMVTHSHAGALLGKASAS